MDAFVSAAANFSADEQADGERLATAEALTSSAVLLPEVAHACKAARPAQLQAWRIAVSLLEDEDESIRCAPMQLCCRGAPGDAPLALHLSVMIVFSEPGSAACSAHDRMIVTLCP